MIEQETQAAELKAARKVNVKQIEKKLNKLEQKLHDIEARISSLQEMRREIKAEIANCKDEQILCLVRSSNLTFEQISESIRLAKTIRENENNAEDYDGLSKLDIEALEESETVSQPFLGGVKNANAQI